MPKKKVENVQKTKLEKCLPQKIESVNTIILTYL